jgi:hypothetical protein
MPAAVRAAHAERERGTLAAIAVRERVHVQLIELFTRYQKPGGIIMPAKAFLVTART